MTLPETLSVAVPTVPPLLTVQAGEAPRVMFEEMAWVIAEVLAELVTVMAELVPREILPPERVMFPEAEPKVIEFAFTVPETVIVPAASPAEAVPKFRASEVVVVFDPDMALVPAEEVLQPWVELLVVGAAQVPCAVPKPAVESFESQ